MRELKLVGIAPLGIPLDRNIVREVWDTYIKPGQDAGEVQSGEERALMACLRTVYISLPPTEQEPDND